MQAYKIKKIEENDIEQVFKMWNDEFQESYRNPLRTSDDLKKETFEKETFDREGSFIAHLDSEILGTVLSFGDRKFENDNYWHMIVAGWIGLILVHPSKRRQGIGRKLLKKAEVYHQKRGRLLLFTGGGEGMYNLFPGIDEQWKAAKLFFEKEGYKFVRRTCFVNIDLTSFKILPNVIERRRTLEREGITIELANPEDASLYSDFSKEMESADPDKSAEVMRKNPQRFIVARTVNEMVGVVSGIRIDKEGEAGYGGITTLPSFRNRGIGRVMLSIAIERCRQIGGINMLLWTRPATAERFYLKLGFHIEKNYDVYAKKLSQNFLAEKWIARYRYL